MLSIKNHDEILQDCFKVIVEANEAWFWNYPWSKSDQIRLDEALSHIKYFRNKLKRREK
jgi:hypothetical protein